MGGLTRGRGTTILLGPPDLYGLTGLVQTTYAYYFTVHTAYWHFPDASLPLSLGSQDLAAVLRPLDATSWAEVPLALQLETPEGRTVLLQLTFKRRRLPHPSFDPLSDLPIFPEPPVPRPIIATGATAAPAQMAPSAGTAPILRICHTTPKIRLRLPHNGNEEVLQDGYRLVLLPKLAYYAMWDGHGERFAVPRATSKGAEASLPSGSYTSAPDMGTDTPGHPSAFRTDAHSKPEVASEECPELLLHDWLPGLAGQAPDVRDFAPGAHPGAANAGHPPNSPCSISSDSSPPSLGASVSLPLHSAAAGAAQGAEPCVSVLAPGSPGGTTPGWDQAQCRGS